MEIIKLCVVCRTDKGLSEYRKQAKSKDGHKNICKECQDADAKRRYAENKEHYIAKVKEWQAANPEKVMQYKRKHKRGPVEE